MSGGVVVVVVVHVYATAIQNCRKCDVNVMFKSDGLFSSHGKLTNLKEWSDFCRNIRIKCRTSMIKDGQDVCQCDIIPDLSNIVIESINRLMWLFLERHFVKCEFECEFDWVYQFTK